MSSTPGIEHLSGHHRDTLLAIFQHPTSHNIEWHDVVSLLNAVGSIEERQDDMFRFRLGDQTSVVSVPTGTALDVQQVADLRRLLSDAGYDAVAAELTAKGKEV
jgi:hypothetical protein